MYITIGVIVTIQVSPRQEPCFVEATTEDSAFTRDRMQIAREQSLEARLRIRCIHATTWVRSMWIRLQGSSMTQKWRVSMWEKWGSNGGYRWIQCYLPYLRVQFGCFFIATTIVISSYVGNIGPIILFILHTNRFPSGPAAPTQIGWPILDHLPKIIFLAGYQTIPSKPKD